MCHFERNRCPETDAEQDKGFTPQRRQFIDEMLCDLLNSRQRPRLSVESFGLKAVKWLLRSKYSRKFRQTYDVAANARDHQQLRS